MKSQLTELVKIILNHHFYSRILSFCHFLKPCLVSKTRKTQHLAENRWSIICTAKRAAACTKTWKSSLRLFEKEQKQAQSKASGAAVYSQQLCGPWRPLWLTTPPAMHEFINITWVDPLCDACQSRFDLRVAQEIVHNLPGSSSGKPERTQRHIFAFNCE